MFFYVVRTLLALGCHIVHANPAAEEDLKKVKLPKKYVPYAGYYIYYFQLEGIGQAKII